MCIQMEDYTATEVIILLGSQLSKEQLQQGNGAKKKHTNYFL
jgi:hypothetical protein